MYTYIYIYDLLYVYMICIYIYDICIHIYMICVYIYDMI